MGKKSRRQAVIESQDLPLRSKPLQSMYTAGVIFTLSLTTLVVAAQFKSQPRLQSFTITNTYPHDPGAFTQGLEYDEICDPVIGNCTDVLWESTGMNGESEVRLVELNTGKVIRSTKCAHEDFGEGLVKVKDRLLQLTWRSNKVLSYSANNLEDVKTLKTSLKDGWGITNGGKPDRDLVISDGTAMLHFVDPDTLSLKKSLEVKDDENAIMFLNELEWVRGEIWANVWQTQCIARIHPVTGKIRGWILLHGLKEEAIRLGKPQPKPMDVLNGIAWDSKRKRLFVTGKYWPLMFEIKLRPHPGRLRPEVLEMARKQCAPNNFAQAFFT